MSCCGNECAEKRRFGALSRRRRFPCKEKRPATPSFSFDAEAEDALSEIEECIGEFSPKHLLRWNAIKVFEGEERTIDALSLPPDVLDRVSKVRTLAEEHFDDDAESIITNERYDAIGAVYRCVRREESTKGMTTTQKIDRVVTNRCARPSHLRRDHVRSCTSLR